jgi:hypothetical protein
VSDTYQAVYDAVRSRISNGDIGFAVSQAMRNAGIDHAAEMANRSVQSAVAQYERPSVLFRPKVFLDGDQWCVLYGEDIQSGVCGFGDSPYAATYAFDAAWYKKTGHPAPATET